MFRIAIDTGGTFTDYLAVNELGQMQMLKVPTKHENPAAGIVDGLHQLAALWGYELPAMLAETDQLVHGTTLALNALLEGRGTKTALLTTAGFRDALELRRSRLANQWDFRAPLPPVLVPRRWRLGIKERVDYRGQVLTPLEEEQLADVADELKKGGIQSVAVCFLFSFQNNENEQKAANLLRRLMPGTFITASSDISPRIREYERTSTTVLNAFLTPVLVDYLSTLEELLKAYGWYRPLHIMLNNGGLAESKTVKSSAVKTLLSGPSGGATGAVALAKHCEKSNLIMADMGGTSFDVTMVSGGTASLASEAEIAGYPVTIPIIDVRSIGAGGGSIAWVKESGRLIVGPRSAGSIPGPACYNRGGLEPTVTDAALLLGLLNPKGFLDGHLHLDAGLAKAAVNKYISVPLSIPTDEAALAIFQVAAAKMADAIRLVTVQQGLDPRNFTLVAAGGAFALFAALIGEELNMPEVIIPFQGPVFCAWGMLGGSIQSDAVKSCLMSQSQWDLQKLSQLLSQLLEQCQGELTRQGIPRTAQEAKLALDMKYTGQHHEIRVPVEMATFHTQNCLQLINKYFHQQHLKLYGYCEPDKPWEIVDLHLTTHQCSPTLPVPSIHWDSSARPLGFRQILVKSGHPQRAAVFNGRFIPQIVCGPALIEFPYTTVLVPEGFVAKVHQKGYLALHREVSIA